MLTGHVRIAGAEALRIEFDRQCSTERRHDPLTIMDGMGRIVSIRSGRDWSDWSAELRVSGDEIKWKFNSDGSVNGWGWRMTVYPIMPAAGPQNTLSDRSVLSRPSMALVMWLLDSSLSSSALTDDRLIGPRLAAALAACAQLSALPASQRMWSLQSLRKLMTFAASSDALSLNISQMMQTSASSSSAASSAAAAATAAAAVAVGSSGDMATMASSMVAVAAAASVASPAAPVAVGLRSYAETALSVLVKGLPEMLLRQFEYEDPIVRGGKHLLHSAFFKELAALACDLGLDSLPCCSETYKWAWFRRYCMAARVADALVHRRELPQAFCIEVRKKIIEMSCEEEDEFTLDHENHAEVFSSEHDRQLLAWLHRRPEDWTLSWGGAGTIYGWGHNHRGQLGGVDGAKVKVPTPCESLSALRPVQLVGGEQTLFAVTADGKVYATGYGAGGRLGVGGTDSVCQPNLLESIQHVFIKQVRNYVLVLACKAPLTSFQTLNL